MSLENLANTLRDREEIEIGELREGMRVAVKLEGGLDVMKIASLGKGAPHGARPGYVMVAKVCPGQASVVVGYDGSVTPNTLWNTGLKNYYSGPYDLGTVAEYNPAGEVDMGVLAGHTKAHWVPVDDGLKIIEVTRREMQRIQEALPVNYRR